VRKKNCQLFASSTELPDSTEIVEPWLTTDHAKQLMIAQVNVQDGDGIKALAV
jgi:hypothetical protein